MMDWVYEHPFWTGFILFFALPILIILIILLAKALRRLPAGWGPWFGSATYWAIPVVVVAALAFIGIPYVLEFLSGQTIGIFDNTSWLLICATIIGVGLALWLGPWRRILAFSAITILVFWVLNAYRTGSVEYGYNRPLLYLLAIGVAALLAEAVSGRPKRETITAAALVFAVFTLLGFSHMWTYEEFVEKVKTGPTKPGINYSPPARPAIPANTAREVTFSSNPIQVDPYRALDMWHEGSGCLYFKRAAWTKDQKTYGPICKGRTDNPSMPRDIEWVWSDGRVLQGSIVQPPPRYN